MTDYTAILTEAYTADFTWDEEDLCELIHRLATALSTAQGEVEARWRTMESLPASGLVLAATDDGRRMIWEASILQAKLTRTHPTPDHLQFPATYWMPLARPPQGGDGT